MGVKEGVADGGLFADVAVFEERRIRLGHVVCARIELPDGDEPVALAQRTRKPCRSV